VTRLLNLIRTTKSISAMTTVQLSTAMKQTGKIIRLVKNPASALASLHSGALHWY